MTVFGTLVWCVVYFVIWVPVALMYRVIFGRRITPHHVPTDESVWRLRRTKRFAPMDRMR